MGPIAHTRRNGNENGWDPHCLETHLRDVSKLAAEFAAAFSSQEWASLAGLWHDLGKYQPEFQHYIRSASGFDAHIETISPGKVKHAIAGAIHAFGTRAPTAASRLLDRRPSRRLARLVTVLPLLMKLKNHHLAKLPNRGEAVNLEKLLGAIFDGLGAVPSRLTLVGQAQFAIGYYHQRQAFFAKPEAETPDQSAA